MEYKVVWRDGPLGAELQAELGKDMPPVVGRIAQPDSAAALANIRVGDVLVGINDVDTASQGFDHSIDLLRTTERPVTLRFRVPRRLLRATDSTAPGELHERSSISSSSSIVSDSTISMNSSISTDSSTGTYDIVWREGDLGLKFRPGDHDVLLIAKLTRKGTATGVEAANVRDELVSLNGVLVEGQAYYDTLRMIKRSTKPVVLRFRPGRDYRASCNLGDLIPLGRPGLIRPRDSRPLLR